MITSVKSVEMRHTDNLDRIEAEKRANEKYTELGRLSSRRKWNTEIPELLIQTTNFFNAGTEPTMDHTLIQRAIQLGAFK